MKLEPVALSGRLVRLEPLTHVHVEVLARVGLEPEIWRWNPRPPLANREDMARYVDHALAQQALGFALPFATIARASGRVVGSTRFHSFEPAQRRLEIGYTWLAPWAQRSGINTEAKYLMLRHAFETLRCSRVEFKTDALNARSRAAILRIGATEEGTLRHHMVTASGRLRDSVYFSIITSEWPAVRARLEQRLGEAQERARPVPLGLG
jgi:RimJ/RimL family protein N-acetyltransferase